jgi:cell wall-associated NlpC family hydrolase
MARTSRWLTLAAAATLLTLLTLPARPASATPAALPAATTAVSVALPAVTVAKAATHVVVRGDTLWALAARYCGRGQLYTRLAAANRVADPDRIRVGQRLVTTCTATARRTPATRVDTVIRFALAQVGKPYQWGAAGPSRYDCSGLVMAAYARIGIRLPHQSGAMLGHGRRVSRAQLRPGDLVWPHPGHVGIYVGGGRFVHASNPRTDIYVGRLYSFWQARRVV